MEYKHIYKLSDLPKIALYMENGIEELKSSLEDFINKKGFVYNAVSSNYQTYINNSLFSNGKLSFKEIEVKYSDDLNNELYYNNDVNEEDIFFIEYTTGLFEALDKEFIKSSDVSRKVNWYYKANMNIEIDGDQFLPLDKSVDSFYKRIGETFDKILIKKLRTSSLPTKQNVLNEFSLHTSDTIEINGFDRIEDIETGSYISDTESSFENEISVSADVVVNDGIVDLASDEVLEHDFKKRDLSNVFSYDRRDKDWGDLDDKDIPTLNEVDDKLSLYKNKDSDTIDSNFRVQEYQNNLSVLTAKTLVALIKSKLDDIYSNVLLSEKDKSDLEKIYDYYVKKIEEIKEQYLLKEGSSLISESLLVNDCKEPKAPITLTSSKTNCSNYMVLEDSEKVLLKGDLKKLLIQCLKENTRI